MRGEGFVSAAFKRPVTVTMISIAATILSLFAYGVIPLELIPSGFTPPFLFVQVPTLYSAPQDIETDVVLPVEKELGFVRNIDTLRTKAKSDGGEFFIRFVDGTDMDVAYNDVREHVLRGISDSSSAIGQPFLWKYNPEDDPVMWFGLTAPEDRPRPEIPVKDTLVPALERVPGVSRVQLFGVPSPEVNIEVDPDRSRLVPGGLIRIVERIAQDNFSMALGTGTGAIGTVPIRFVANISTLSVMRDLPIAEGVRLQDVADVTIEDSRARSVYRINGRPGMFVGVYRDTSSNLVTVGRELRAALTEMTETNPELRGFDTHIFFDQAALIEGTIDELQRTAMWGALFAVIVLFLFLRRWQITLIVALAIPMSLLLTVGALYVTDSTLNVLSLTGMMLSVGLVVDNSIVVAESIQRALAEGDDARRAAIRGTGEVALAVLVATLTSIAVFVPIVLMPGSEMLTFYLGEIGLPVCSALVASLFTSLILVPLLSAFFLPAEPADAGRLMQWVERKYRNALALVLRRRGDSALIMAILMATIVIPIKNVPTSDQMEANINDVRLSLDFEPGMTWDERVEGLLVFEAAVLEAKDDLEIRDIRVGLGDVGIGGTEIRVFLLPPEERKLSRKEVIEHFDSILPTVSGVEPELSWSGFQQRGDSSLRVRLVGPDSNYLVGIAGEVADRLEAIDGVQSVVPADQAQDEMELIFEPMIDQLAFMGVSSQAVALTLDYALRGRQLSALGTGAERLPIIVHAKISEDGALQDLEEMRLAGAPSSSVADVTRQTMRPALREIERENRRTSFSLVIQSTRDDIEALSKEVDEAIADIPFPRGYGVEKAGRFSFLEEGGGNRNFALILALMFVFVLMGILFESFLIPFAILFSVPFAMLGVYWTIYLTNGSLDVMVAVGLLILVGIVVNNAIVLVDLARELERRGWDRRIALLTAGERRLRPILMTAATTIIGMTPMALSRTTLVGVPYAPLGQAVIGGLVASTAITLFVVPVFYSLLQSLSDRSVSK